ncbi:MAG: hypothetical protein ACO38V_11050 [Phycisphaerales bacterium]
MPTLAATLLAGSTLLLQETPPGNAATLYRQAFTAWEALAAEDREAIANAFGDPQVLVAEDSTTAAALTRAKPALDLFTQAGRLESCDWNLDRSEGFALLLPHLGPMRALSRAAALSAVGDFAAGRSEAAVAMIESISRSTRHIAADPFLVDSLVGGAMLGISTSAIDSAIDAGALDAATAAKLLEALPTNPSESLGADRAIRTEGEIFAQEIERIRGGEETIADDMIESETEGGLASLRDVDDARFDAAMAKVLDFGDRAALAMAETNPQARSASLAAIDAEVAALREADPQLAGTLLSLVPSYEALGQAIARVENRILATRARLDALASGEDPDTLANAAIEYLRAATFLAQTPPRLQVSFELLRLAPSAADEAMRREANDWLDRIDTVVLERLRRAGAVRHCDFDFGRADDIAPGDVLMRAVFPSLRGGARLLLVEAKRRLEQAAAMPAIDEEARLEATAIRTHAVDDLVAVVAMARHLAGDATVGGTLVSASILQDLAASIGAMRSDGLLDSGALEALRTAGAALPRGDAGGPLGVDAASRRIDQVAIRGSTAERPASIESALVALALVSDGCDGLVAIVDQPLLGADDLVNLDAWARLRDLHRSWSQEAAARVDRVVRVGEIPTDSIGGVMAPPCTVDGLRPALTALAAIDEAIDGTSVEAP